MSVQSLAVAWSIHRLMILDRRPSKGCSTTVLTCSELDVARVVGNLKRSCRHPRSRLKDAPDSVQRSVRMCSKWTGGWVLSHSRATGADEFVVQFCYSVHLTVADLALAMPSGDTRPSAE